MPTSRTIDMNSDVYVIRNRINSDFIKIDQSSGGYPSETDIFNASHFGKNEANDYRNTMNAGDCDLYKLYVNDRRVTWDLISWDHPIPKRDWE